MELKDNIVISANTLCSSGLNTARDVENAYLNLTITVFGLEGV